MIKYFSCILFSLLIGKISAQTTGNIQGTVFEVDTGEPMIGATVSLMLDSSDTAKEIMTSTDIFGFYNFPKVAIGTYTIVASFIGCNKEVKDSIVITENRTVVVDFEIKETIDLALVEVEAEPIRSLALRSVSSIAVTTAGVSSSNRGGRNKGKRRRKSRSRKTRKTNNYSYQTGTTRKKQKATSKSAIPPVEKPTNETYGSFAENGYEKVEKEPLSTFSIDVDRASYSNIRRYLNRMQKPPKDAVRIEEMVNYFNYNYPQPTAEHPFSVSTEVSDCPWNKEAQLVHIGLQGKKIDLEKAPASNLVFLIDVSGSMSDANKLPLLKASLKLLINNMRSQDKIAIVVYAGAAGLIQEATNDKSKLLAALDRLEAGGSTAGGAGIELAYKVAKNNLIKEGNNRVIIATDGDFNVGASSAKDLEKLIVEKRKDAIFLTVLGYGMGNYKDDRMEVLADKGNGNYAYIDNIKEAKKTLVKEMGGTLYAIAKDVKIQVEFNPAQVASYRLVGYENRLLNKEDFKNDKKDAGELGAGHTVTALYEVVLSKEYKPSKSQKKVKGLIYQSKGSNALTEKSNELMTVKLRYKQPKKNKSILVKFPLVESRTPIENASENFRFAVSVAGFGMLLRDSKFKNDLSYKTVLDLAQGAKGEDQEGYRAEYIEMVSNVLSMDAQTSR